jgi:hypothetical protein
MRLVATFTLTSALAVGACSRTESPPAKSASATAAASVAVGSGGSTCPATGLWAECSVVYRLERSGLAPHVDSTASPEEKELTGKPLIIKLGQTATLEVYIYPDSNARITDGKKLDRTKLIDGEAQQTIARERTLIESANVIGLLTSLSSHQRERVSDALMAGAPQPDKPK